MSEIACEKRKAKYAGEIGLFGVDEHADEEIKRLGNDHVWAKITSPRSIKMLRFFWALCTKLANAGMFDDKDAAMDALLIRVGWYRKIVDMDGNIKPEPRSISRIDTNQLKRIINRVLDAVCAELLTHIEPADLRHEIEEMIG